MMEANETKERETYKLKSEKEYKNIIYFLP